MNAVRLAGVPEHFNMPWQLLIQSKKLNKKGINLIWQDFPAGTGAMIEALNANEVDVAMLLTEGAIKGIDNGGKYKIVSFYVDSPLVWGIHVPASSDYQTMSDVKGKKYAISRYGSGSHLMSYVDAQQRGWPTDNLKFELVENLEGARQAFKEKSADVFYWEKFTTKKYVDSGEFRRIGECPTPYACFVICVSEKALKEKKEQVFKVLKAAMKAGEKLHKNPDNINIIATHYQISAEDISVWLQDVKWSKSIKISKKAIKKALKMLKSLSLIDSQLKFKNLVHQNDKIKAENGTN